MNFVAIDIETAQSQPWSICQLGLSIVEEGQLIRTLSFLVQPPANKYFFWNSRVHGIIPFMTRNSPFFPEVWQEIAPILQNQKLVAHNAQFDIGSLKQTLEYYKLEVPRFDYVCTYQLTRAGLERACRGYGIPLNKHHDAACDAEACARLYLKLLQGEKPHPDWKKPRPKNKSPFNGHERLSGDILTPLQKVENPDNPFFGRKVVFTGVLSGIQRLEAATRVRNMGGHISCVVSAGTDMVVTGFRPGPVKMEKIHNFNEQGSQIRIITEEEFLKMINS